MPPFLFSCPNTGQTVQGFTAEEVPDDASEFAHLPSVPTNPFR